MYVDHGRGVQSTSRIVERLQSFMRFVQTVFIRALDQLCRNGCGRQRCRFCRSSSSYIGTGNGWPEPEINDVPLLPSTTTTTASPEGVASHRKLCWDFEEEEAQCLNGGSCFAIELHNGMRRSGCSCAPNWTGDRCEMRYIDPVFWEDSDEHYYRTASVSSEVFLLIVVIFVFLSAAYIYLRHQRSRSNNLSQSSSCSSCLSIRFHLHTSAVAAADDDRDSLFCREHTHLLIPTKNAADVTLLPIESDLVPKSCPAFRGTEVERNKFFAPKEETLSSADDQPDGSSLVNNSSNHRNLSNKGLSRKSPELLTSTPDIII